MSELIIETEILKKVEKLYNEVYFLYCKLDRYRDKIESQAAVKFMSNNLYLLCREEFRRIYEPYEIEYDKEKYTHKKRRGKFLPRETWFLHRKNLSAKYFIDGVAEEADGFFSAFKKKLAEQKRNRPVRRFFRCLFKRGNPAPETVPTTGVNVLSEQAAPHNVANPPPESLPISTLQACDELVNFARTEEGLPPPKGFAEWYRKFTATQVAELVKVLKEPKKIAEQLTMELAQNEPPTPQNPPKQGKEQKA